MKNKNILYMVVFLIISLFVTFNCTQNNPIGGNNEDKNIVKTTKLGNLNLTIVNKTESRTIYPVFKPVSYYDITGDGPDGNTLTVNGVTDTSKLISSLLTGKWNITVSGKDGSNDIIVRGTNIVSVIEDTTVDLTVDVNYLQNGSGKVDITLDWTGASIAIDEVELKIDNDPASDIYISGESVNYTNSAFISGFHRMVFKIKKLGLTIASVTESVHIYDNLITSKTINLTAADFKKPPVAPSGLTATEGTGKIVLNWTDNSNVETGFVVERSETSGSEFSVIGGTDVTPLSANTATFNDAAVVLGTTYYYRVKAVNSFGSSGYSNDSSSKFEIPEILSIIPSNNSTSIELSSDIKITFNQPLNASIIGFVNFNNPSIKFEDSTNCGITFITTNKTNDTILINPYIGLLENTTYINITIDGFVDTVGNYMSVYNNVSYNFKTVDLTAPPAPVISIDPSTPTNGDVTVTIDFSPDSVIKQYKIGAGLYNDYTGSFSVSSNDIIYAKSKDAADNWSNEGSFTVTNIDKISPTATVSYSTTTATNGDVTATITPSETVTITNNDGSASKVFTANGSFTFEFIDAAGNTGSAIATVSNIDKSSPTATVSYSTTLDTSADVIATITPSETVTITNNGGSASKVFMANGSFTFNFTDTAGNTGSATATVSNIDKTAPTATVSYSTTTATNGDVTATITPSETVTITNNDGSASKVFTANSSFTFEFVDTAGNTGSVTATVSNIDTTVPTATVAYSTTAPTNGDVTATITPSETVTITNNDGSASKVFTANGSFTFEFVDTAGNTGTVTATVSNIDKSSPTATVAYSTTAQTNGDVTATITPSETVTITNNDGSASKVFTANGSFTFEFIDTAGNTGTVTATVANIDKTPPVDPSISINPTTPTSGDVTVTITFSGDSEVKQYKIGTGNYQSYTASFTVSQDTTIYAKAQDAVGNWSGEASYSITNIDRGNFNVTITLVTPTNAVIDFGTYNGTLDKNISQVLNVTATLDGATSWEWYLDNDILASSSANCSIDSSSYDPGPYNLTVFARKGGLTYSGTIKINIEN